MYNQFETSLPSEDILDTFQEGRNAYPNGLCPYEDFDPHADVWRLGMNMQSELSRLNLELAATIAKLNQSPEPPEYDADKAERDLKAYRAEHGDDAPANNTSPVNFPLWPTVRPEDIANVLLTNLETARTAQDQLRDELVAITSGRDELLLALGAEFVPEGLAVIKAKDAEIERLRMALQLIANNAPVDDQLTDYEMVVAGQEMIVAGHLARQALSQK